MGRAVQCFGGQHTELKLRVVTDYLTQYLRVMQKQHFFRLSYIDAFAGTGWSRAGLREDDRQMGFLSPAPLTKGSALRVFDVKNSGRRFDRYVFNDLRPRKRAQLEAEVAALFTVPAERPEIHFSSDTADELIARECRTLQSCDRAVMFLDPFGMQVSWASIRRIAESEAIDLWYLAPVGGAYARLMQRNGKIPDDRRRKLDEALGGGGWQEIYQPLPPDMLGHTQTARDQGYDAIAGYFMTQWRNVFGPGASSATLPLGAPGRLPFLLCFACSNRSPRAYTPALRIAEHLIKEARDGRLI